MVADDPCDPNPCGPNSNPPRQIGDRCQCSCLPEMIGSPPNCRPECLVNADCPTDRACISRKCQDPCPGLCGINANCRVRNHVPQCVCNQGFIGDPFAQCYRPSSKFIYGIRLGYHNFGILATPRPIEVIEPCNPSPCGRNAECTERGQAASCRCILDYIGNPYVECKPECTVNSECPRDKACINNKCGDPCPGVCGAHASCSVNNHNPQCRCDPGYTGNAFVSCSRITTCKSLLKTWDFLLMCLFQLRQGFQSLWIPAILLHVAAMLSATHGEVQQRASVSQITLGIPTLHAGQSVQPTQNVHRGWLA